MAVDSVAVVDGQAGNAPGRPGRTEQRADHDQVRLGVLDRRRDDPTGPVIASVGGVVGDAFVRRVEHQVLVVPGWPR